MWKFKVLVCVQTLLLCCTVLFPSSPVVVVCNAGRTILQKIRGGFVVLGEGTVLLMLSREELGIIRSHLMIF